MINEINSLITEFESDAISSDKQQYHKALKTSVVKCHKNIIDIIKANKNLIDNNPTDYPNPDTTKQGLDELCGLATSALVDQLIPKLYKRTDYHIRHFPNHCESTGTEQTEAASELTDASGIQVELNAPGRDSKDKKLPGI